MTVVGIFGGTFDPIHYGHLRTAFEILQALRFGEVRFVPSGDPPHRGVTYAPAELRLEMVAAAQLASQRARTREAAVKPKKPIWHNPNHIPVVVPPQRHDVRRKKLLAQAAINPPSDAELLEILQLTAHS